MKSKLDKIECIEHYLKDMEKTKLHQPKDSILTAKEFGKIQKYTLNFIIKDIFECEIDSYTNKISIVMTKNAPKKLEKLSTQELQQFKTIFDWLKHVDDVNRKWDKLSGN